MTDSLNTPPRSLEEVRDDMAARLNGLRELDPEIPDLKRAIAVLDEEIARKVKP